MHALTTLPLPELELEACHQRLALAEDPRAPGVLFELRCSRPAGHSEPCRGTSWTEVTA